MDIRTELQRALGHTVPDRIWEHLEDRAYVDEVRDGARTIDELAAEIRYQADLWRPHKRSSTHQLDDSEPAQEATVARINALSAIYTAWAENDSDVRFFRRRALVDEGSPEFGAWLTKKGLYPAYKLLEPTEVDPWVLDQYNAADPDGNGERHIHNILTNQAVEGPKLVNDLWYIADAQERRLTVDARSVLGELVKIADKLAERFRWRTSEATMLILTGRTAETLLYTGSMAIRYGYDAATTRVTMILDPALTPEQVAGIYSRLKAQIQPNPPLRASSVKHYKLAEHVGPRVLFHVDEPSRVQRRGRPRKPGPTGLASFIDPAGGHTWQSLRREWNTLYGQRESSSGRSWHYDSASKFTRDAQQALVRLLGPAWTPPHEPPARRS